MERHNQQNWTSKMDPSTGNPCHRTATLVKGECQEAISPVQVWQPVQRRPWRAAACSTALGGMALYAHLVPLAGRMGIIHLIVISLAWLSAITVAFMFWEIWQNCQPKVYIASDEFGISIAAGENTYWFQWSDIRSLQRVDEVWSSGSQSTSGGHPGCTIYGAADPGENPYFIINGKIILDLSGYSTLTQDRLLEFIIARARLLPTRGYRSSRGSWRGGMFLSQLTDQHRLSPHD